jgi:hypothetical protein
MLFDRAFTGHPSSYGGDLVRCSRPWFTGEDISLRTARKPRRRCLQAKEQVLGTCVGYTVSGHRGSGDPRVRRDICKLRQCWRGERPCGMWQCGRITDTVSVMHQAMNFK